MVDKCPSLFAPRRMILEHLFLKVSGRIEPQAPTVVSYPLVHTCFSNLCPLLFSPPHSATSSELPGVIPQEVVVCASLPWILLLSESMLRSSILLIQSTHVSRLLLTGLLRNRLPFTELLLLVRFVPASEQIHLLSAWNLITVSLMT